MLKALILKTQQQNKALPSPEDPHHPFLLFFFHSPTSRKGWMPSLCLHFSFTLQQTGISHPRYSHQSHRPAPCCHHQGVLLCLTVHSLWHRWLPLHLDSSVDFSNTLSSSCLSGFCFLHRHLHIGVPVRSSFSSHSLD